MVCLSRLLGGSHDIQQLLHHSFLQGGCGHLSERGVLGKIKEEGQICCRHSKRSIHDEFMIQSKFSKYNGTSSKYFSVQ